MYSTDLEKLRRTLRLPGRRTSLVLSETAVDGEGSGSSGVEMGSTHSQVSSSSSLPPSRLTHESVTFLSIPREDVLMVGDSSGMVRLYSLSQGKAIQSFRFEEASAPLANSHVTGGVILPRVNTESGHNELPELLAYATADGLVSVFPLLQERGEVLLLTLSLSFSSHSSHA